MQLPAGFTIGAGFQDARTTADGNTLLNTTVDRRPETPEQLLPRNLDIELGYTHFFSGEFIRYAPNAGHRGDINYFYTRATISF